jgi:hypothetical protein
METESKAVLSSLTENDSQDVFKKWQKCWEWCIGAEEIIHTHPITSYLKQHKHHPVRLVYNLLTLSSFLFIV